MFDKKKLRKFIGVILLLIFIIIMVRVLQNAFARYGSSGTTDTDVKLAFFTFGDTYQEGNIFLNNLSPRPKEAPFEYTFSVSNFKEDQVAETSIEYDMVLEATTNLPLEFEIEKKTNDGDYSKLTEGKDVKTSLELDETGGNYIKKISILNGNFIYNDKATDTYKINVIFPLDYIDKPEFEDIMENIKISLEAQQKLET